MLHLSRIFPMDVLAILFFRWSEPWCDPQHKDSYLSAIVNSTITYAAETWCLKAKTVAKLNSTEMGFWWRPARISRKDKIRNTIIKQKLNVVRSLLDLKPKIFSGEGMFKEWKRGDCQKKLWNGVHQEEENEADLKIPGQKGLEDWWEKRD